MASQTLELSSFLESKIGAVAGAEGELKSSFLETLC